MKTPFLILILSAFSLLLVSTPTPAQRVSTKTGNDLLEECEATEPIQQVFCLGYIMGATDVDGMDGATFPERRRSCVPTGMSNGQLKDIVVKYLKEAGGPDEKWEVNSGAPHGGFTCGSLDLSARAPLVPVSKLVPTK